MLLTAQTTLDEYEYLSTVYPRQIAESRTAAKEGYYFQDLMNMIDQSGKVTLFYKENQASVTPTATLISVQGEEQVYYICLPHEDSDRSVFDRYASDLQQLFEKSELGRTNYSKIMFRYPKQIQKYYDEIAALENGTRPLKLADVTENNTASTPPSRNFAPEPTTTKGSASKVSTVTAEKETVTLRAVEKESDAEVLRRKKGKSSATVQSVLVKRPTENKPEVINETEFVGTVRVDICVNAKGEIISSEHNKTGTDTRNQELIETAEKLAKQYKFSPSHLSRQCGYVIFDFK
jgi:hypothetical protein